MKKIKKKNKKINPNFYFKSKEEIKKYKEDNFKFFEILTFITKFEENFNISEIELDTLINYKEFIRYYVNKYIKYEEEIAKEDVPFNNHFLNVDHYLDMLTLDDDLMEMNDLFVLRKVTSDLIDSDIFLLSIIEMNLDMIIRFKFLSYEFNIEDFKDILTVPLPDIECVKEIKRIFDEYKEEKI